MAAASEDSDGEGEPKLPPLKRELSAAEREAMEQIVEAAINDSTDDDDF